MVMHVYYVNCGAESPPGEEKKPNQVSNLSKIVSKTLLRRCKDLALQNMPDMHKQLCLGPSLNVSDSSAYVWRV